MGATNVEQIDQNVGALDVILPEECLAEVVSVRRRRLALLFVVVKKNKFCVCVLCNYKQGPGDFSHLISNNNE